MYALDTNTLIYFFKGMGKVGERLLATPRSQVALPAFVLFELEVGIAKSQSPGKRRGQLETLLSSVRLLPFDRAAAEASATIRANLERAGNPTGPIDTLIAGTALACNATLVSRNIAEFARVPGLEVTNWFD